MILTGAKLATDRSKAGERRVADDAQPRVQRTQRFYLLKMRPQQFGLPEASCYELD